ALGKGGVRNIPPRKRRRVGRLFSVFPRARYAQTAYRRDRGRAAVVSIGGRRFLSRRASSLRLAVRARPASVPCDADHFPPRARKSPASRRRNANGEGVICH